MIEEGIYRLNKDIQEIKKRLDNIEARLDIQECSVLHIRKQMITVDYPGVN